MRADYALDWHLLASVLEDPRGTIGQRKVGLFFAYDLGYHLPLSPRSARRATEAPDLTAWLTAKYASTSTDLGSRSILSVIEYVSDDERDYFERFADDVIEYVKAHPSAADTAWRRDPEAVGLEVWLPAIRRRPSMYFGIPDLARLRVFLDGYFRAQRDYGISTGADEQCVREFTDAVVCAVAPGRNRFGTWDRRYRFGRDWSSVGPDFPRDVFDEFFGDLAGHLELNGRHAFAAALVDAKPRRRAARS